MKLRYAALATLLLALTAGLAPGVAAENSAPPGAVETGGAVVTGRVVDASTGEPLAFANVGVSEARVGTVADEEGRFRLELAVSTGKLTLSANGYQMRRIALDEVADGADVPLVSDALAIREHVTVTAADSEHEEVFGRVYKKKGFAVGFGSGQLGSQIGARIHIAKPTVIRTAHFVVDHTGGERFLYRVNLYDFTDGKVGANLIGEDVIVEAPQRSGPIDVDLAPYGVVASGDVLLCLEWIKDDAGAGNGNVMFRGGRRGSSLYMRMTSHTEFERIRPLGLGFFLLGSPLE